jgi:hypothetical protein
VKTKLEKEVIMAIKGSVPRYPMLDEKIIKDAFQAPGPLEFTSSKTGVNPEPSDTSWAGPVSFDRRGGWSPSEHDLKVETSISIDATKLFGPKGIACKNAEIGAVLEWTSNESKQRGHSKVVEFKHDSGIVIATFALTFEPNQIREEVLLTPKIYIRKADNSPAKDEVHLANKAGLVLGEIFSSCKLSFDGNGGNIPISEYDDEPQAPLWRIIFDSSAPWTDPFTEDYVCLKINRQHPDYLAYKGSEGISILTPLRIHVIASWLTLFLVILKEKASNLFDELAANSVNDNDLGGLAKFAKDLFLFLGFEALESTEEMAAKINEVVAARFIEIRSQL